MTIKEWEKKYLKDAFCLLKLFYNYSLLQFKNKNFYNKTLISIIIKMTFFKDSFFNDINSSFFNDPFFNSSYPFPFDPYYRPNFIENQIENSLEAMANYPLIRNGIEQEDVHGEEENEDQIMTRNGSNHGKNLNHFTNKSSNNLMPYGEWMKNYQKIFKPRMDITEDNEHYFIHADLPGLSKKDVHMELSDNGILSISGERKWQQTYSPPKGSFTNEDDGDNNKHSSNSNYYKRIERSYGQFKRSFTLPDDIDQNSIQAKLENGVLQVQFNKIKEIPTKKNVKTIDVQ